MMMHSPSHYRRVLLAAWLERFKGEEIRLLERRWHDSDVWESSYYGTLEGLTCDWANMLGIQLTSATIYTQGHDGFAVHCDALEEVENFVEWVDKPDFEPVKKSLRVAA